MKSFSSFSVKIKNRGSQLNKSYPCTDHRYRRHICIKSPKKMSEAEPSLHTDCIYRLSFCTHCPTTSRAASRGSWHIRVTQPPRVPEQMSFSLLQKVKFEAFRHSLKGALQICFAVSTNVDCSLTFPWRIAAATTVGGFARTALLAQCIAKPVLHPSSRCAIFPFSFLDSR
jgi:hypothetical protein